MLFTALAAVGKFLIGLFTGGTLDKILDTLDKRMDAGAEREKIKAEVTIAYTQAQANLLVGRTWWFQLFFVVPLGLWWASVIIDSILVYFSWYGHTTAALPPPLDTWAGWIISALFVVDGTKALIGRWK